MKIRRANLTDKSGIQILMDELNLYCENNVQGQNEEFHKRTKPNAKLSDKDFESSYIFIAISDKNVIGYIQGTIHQRKNHELSNLGYVDELFVKDGFRGDGIAEKLFIKLAKEFKKQGCDHITTHTNFENQLAQRFYSKIGMREVTIEYWKKI